jgi:hypothetical protein
LQSPYLTALSHDDLNALKLIPRWHFDVSPSPQIIVPQSMTSPTKAQKLIEAVVAAAAMAKSQAPDPDRVLRVTLAAEFPSQMWYFTGAFIFVVALSNLVILLSDFRYRRSRIQHENQARVQSQNQNSQVIDTSAANRRTNPALTRLPFAIVDFVRVVAFRWSLPVGRNLRLSVAEVFVFCGWTTAIFMWTFLKCTSRHFRVSLA